MRKFFHHNQTVKLGSFLAAVVLWIFAVSLTTRTGFFPGTIPLQLKNIPTQLTALANVDTVRVRLSADPSAWRQLSPGSFIASVDVAGQAVGLAELPVQLTVAHANVQVLEVLPKTVEVQIEAMATKSVPITVKTEGEPATGFFSSAATTDPTSITIRGAQSSVNRLDAVTAVVDVAGANADRDELINVQALDSANHGIGGLQLVPPSIKVHQPVTKLAATKTVGIRVVTAGSPPAGNLIFPSATAPSTVTIAGSAAQLAAIDALPTRPIDVSSIKQRTSVKSAIDLPAGMTLTGSTSVDVTFDVVDQEASLAVAPTLIFTGLTPDRNVGSVDPAAPTVVVRGPQRLLSAMKSGDVTLTVDLTGRGAGIVHIPLTTGQLHLPDGMSVQQLLTGSIAVTIQ